MTISQAAVELPPVLRLQREKVLTLQSIMIRKPFGCIKQIIRIQNIIVKMYGKLTLSKLAKDILSDLHGFRLIVNIFQKQRVVNL